MTVINHLTSSYAIAHPYEGTYYYKDRLITGEPIVIEDNHHFVGLLTYQDLLINPHKIIVDTVTPKQPVDLHEDARSVLLSMCQLNADHLPVFEKGNFSGIVSRKKLFFDLYLNKNQNDTTYSQGLCEELATKNKFLALFGHDLKNLFNQVLGGLELLESGNESIEGNDRMKMLLTMSRKSAQQIYSVFDNMLTWARLGSSQLTMHPERISIKETFDNILRNFQLASTLKEISLENLMQSDFEIYSDRNMLNCVLTNLVNNAVKFTPPKGRIWLEARKEGNLAKISISDSGLGISQEVRESLFNPQTYITSDEAGTGIGLLICKEFMDRHNGTISISSDVGLGTSIMLSFPCDVTVTDIPFDLS